MFDQLRKSFAQTAGSDEDAYLEIAKKLMRYSDRLGSLEQCMDLYESGYIREDGSFTIVVTY